MGTPFTLLKFVWNFGVSRENVFDMYEDSRENWLNILAVVIVLSSISAVRMYICIRVCTTPHLTPLKCLCMYMYQYI